MRTSGSTFGSGKRRVIRQKSSIISNYLVSLYLVVALALAIIFWNMWASYFFFEVLWATIVFNLLNWIEK